MNRHSAFDCMFAPRSVAVVGATVREGSVGRNIVENLRAASHTAKLYAVNPKYRDVLGLECYNDVGSVPEKVDLAVIVTPAPTVPSLIRDCVKSEVGAAVVISAGFRERGAEGVLLEEQIQRELRGSKTRLIGPNCLGIMRPAAGINATFAQAMALPGSVAFLSQSGALETAILDWSLREGVGFSAMVSTGSMLDVGWGDLIDYFGEDEHTRSILLYLESVGDARSFISAAREVALRKPIIVIKAGRSAAAAHAATSHTGALTGSDQVFDAAVRRCGILRVQSISDLFHMAEVLDRQPRPQGPRLSIVTNAGGPAVLATDAVIAYGGQLATLSDESLEALNRILPPHWSHGNPIDVLGDAGADQYARAFDIAIHDPNCDGLLAILAPQGVTHPTRAAECLAPFAHGSHKPVLASWMGGRLVAEGQAALNKAGIATFAYPDAAARAFCYMWQHRYNLLGIYETPSLAEEVGERNGASEAAASVLEAIRHSARTLLTEAESKKVLSLYGIPVAQTEITRSEQEAADAARRLGFPVVLKVHSETITHKTDVGGVKLDLPDERAVRRAYREIESAIDGQFGAGKFQGVTVQKMVRPEGYELILGSSVDPQFGPVVLFGSGGSLVEVYRDRALALPPLNATLAKRLIEQTRISTALKGIRGRRPVDLAELERVLVRFAKLIVEQPWIKESDINPLLVSPDGLIALDARIVLHDANLAAADLPKLAVRPYPSQYVGQWQTKAGTPVLIRPIRPEDEPLLVKFHETLSGTSVYLRYFHMMSLDVRVAHLRLQQQCFIDYDRDMALVVDFHDPASGQHEILAVGRLSKVRGSPEAEVAVLVTDQYQRQGIGGELMRRLIEVARDEKLERIVANVLPENEPMRSLSARFGFQTVSQPTPDGVLAVLDLARVSP